MEAKSFSDHNSSSIKNYSEKDYCDYCEYLRRLQQHLSIFSQYRNNYNRKSLIRRLLIMLHSNIINSKSGVFNI